MLKSTLAALLVVTQAMSCGAMPVFVCIDRAGAVCVDFGPDACGGCEHESGACSDECPAKGLASSHDRHSTPQLEHLSDDGCDCKHVRISQSQNGLRPGEVDDLNSSGLAALDLLAGGPAAIVSPSGHVGHCRLAEPFLSAGLAVGTPAVMRC